MRLSWYYPVEFPLKIIKSSVSLDDYFVVQLLFAIVIECGKLYLDYEWSNSKVGRSYKKT